MAFDDWMLDNPVTKTTHDWREKFLARFADMDAVFADMAAKGVKINYSERISMVVTGLVYALTGWRTPFYNTYIDFYHRSPADVSQSLAKAIEVAMANPMINDFVETIGTMISDPVVDLFIKYSEQDQLDPREFVRALAGLHNTVNIVRGIANTTIESLSAGQFKWVDEFFSSIEMSLGMHLISHESFLPLLNAGMKPRLEAYYARRFRPRRFWPGSCATCTRSVVSRPTR